MNISDFEMWLDYLTNRKETFDLFISKYTVVLKSYNEETGKETRKSFSDKSLNFKIFHIVKKLKTEVEIWLMNNENFHEVKERAMIRHYNYVNNLPKEIKEFYFVDISAAYLTSLYLNNIISEFIFNLINELPKKDRLITLGMLAYEPFKIPYVDGIKGEIEKVRNYYSPVFYTACALIETLMDDLIKLISDKGELLSIHSFDRSENYLFYWVDGLFFRNKNDINTISEFLTNKGYKFRIGTCYNWKLKEHDNYFNLEFEQEDKGKLEKKVYNIPYHFQNIKDRTENIKLLRNGDFPALFAKFKEQKYGNINGNQD